MENQTVVKDKELVDNKPVDNKPVDNKKKMAKGILLWALVITGYFIFVFNWMVMDQMQFYYDIDDKLNYGWAYEFGLQSKGSAVFENKLAIQSANFTITFMRGIGAFLAGYLLVKVGHKYSIYIAMGLLLFGVVAPWVANAGEGFFWLFILLRMLMAVGGTTLIVYTQPIIANYFSKPEQKSKLNVFNSVGFNFGSICAITPFIFWAGPLTKEWQLVSTIFAAVSIVILVLYIIFGEDIDLNTTEKSEDTSVTYKSVLKEKRTWIFSLSYVFWLVVVVLFLTMIIKYPIASANPWFNQFKNREGFGGHWAQGTLKVLFLLGVVPGYFAFKFIPKSTYSRKPLIATVLAVGIFAMLISVLLAAFTGGDFVGTNSDGEDLYSASAVGLAFSMIFIFISGVCLWGIQGILLGMTYSYEGATPKKQGILLGFIWGIGYMGLTIANIIMVLLMMIGGDNTGLIIATVFFFAASFLSPAIFMLATETHKDNNFFKVKYTYLKEKLVVKK